jgi:hypothetical protein
MPPAQRLENAGLITAQRAATLQNKDAMGLGGRFVTGH